LPPESWKIGRETYGCYTFEDSSSEVVEKGTYTVAEVAALMGLYGSTVTRVFEHEPGVIILERPERMHERRYRSIRIPLAVRERVANRMTVM
jgi:hypothetical protein